MILEGQGREDSAESFLETFFAPATRATDQELRRDIELACNNPIMSAVLSAAPGVIAVLNTHRQILAVNDVFLRMLGAEDAGAVLGMRPGEAIRCIHAHDHPGGCGTGRSCATCEAVKTVMTSLESQRPEERDCMITAGTGGIEMDLYLKVRAYPITMKGRRFILLFLQDITMAQRRAELERVFFHDLGNILMGLQGASLYLDSGDPQDLHEGTERIRQLIGRLIKEVEIQRGLCNGEMQHYLLELERVSVDAVVQEIGALFAKHPAAEGRALRITETLPRAELKTDRSLLLRILTNMLANAFEATEKGGDVKLWVEETPATVVFCVWNGSPIPDEVALRVFERHFTTKPEPGRGLGTYAMKLLAEELLGGKVTFTTSGSEGTVFRLELKK